MPSVKGPRDAETRRLLAAADLAGDADGRVDARELGGIKSEVLHKDVVRGHAHADVVSGTRADAYERARARLQGAPVMTLSEPLRRLPEPLRRLALEIDSLWGDADGRVTTAEIDRVARYTLAALPFFTKEAGDAILELADYLGLDVGARAAPSVLELRLAVADVDSDEVARGEGFRKLFDEALAAGEVPGLPGMLRDAATHSPRWHSLSILEHTAAAVAAARSLSSSLGVDWRAAGATLLLHDVGKILEREGHASGFSYDGHDSEGAKWLAQRGVPEDVVFHVRHHADLREMSADEVEALFGTKQRLREALVVYVANQMAKGSTPDQLASFDEQAPKIAELCSRCSLDADALFGQRRALIMKHFGVDPGMPAPK